MRKIIFAHFLQITLGLISITFPKRCQTDCNINYDSGVVAVILARGGSKGIPHKNLAQIDGVSLLGRALRTIHNCNCFVEVWVSTDDEKIASEAYRYNASVHYRSKHSARDEATSLEAIQEFLSRHQNIKNVALIQCTSIFLREVYLAAAVKRFSSQSDIDCIFSVYRLLFVNLWLNDEFYNCIEILM